MIRQNALLAFPLAMLFASVALAQQTGHSQPCVTPGCTACQYGGGQCPGYGCRHCADQPEDDGWWSRFRRGFNEKCRKTTTWWFRQHQRHKQLQHPECPPFCRPNWGYHEPCWRQFPPLCNPCPQPLTTPPQDYPPPSPEAQTHFRDDAPVQLSLPAAGELDPTANDDRPVWQPTRDASEPRPAGFQLDLTDSQGWPADRQPR